MTDKNSFERVIEAQISGAEQQVTDLLRDIISEKTKALVIEARGDMDAISPADRYGEYDGYDEQDPYEAHFRESGNFPVDELNAAFDGVGCLFLEKPATQYHSKEEVLKMLGDIDLVNDTTNPDFMAALRETFAPIDNFVDQNRGMWINTKEVDIPALESIFEPTYIETEVGKSDYYSLAKLAEVMPQVLPLLDSALFSYDDARAERAEDDELRNDPYGSRGLRKSDFL